MSNRITPIEKIFDSEYFIEAKSSPEVSCFFKNFSGLPKVFHRSKFCSPLAFILYACILLIAIGLAVGLGVGLTQANKTLTSTTAAPKVLAEVKSTKTFTLDDLVVMDAGAGRKKRAATYSLNGKDVTIMTQKVIDIVKAKSNPQDVKALWKLKSGTQYGLSVEIIWEATSIKTELNPNASPLLITVSSGDILNEINAKSSEILLLKPPGTIANIDINLVKVTEKTTQVEKTQTGATETSTICDKNAGICETTKIVIDKNGNTSIAEKVTSSEKLTTVSENDVTIVNDNSLTTVKMNEHEQTTLI